MEELKEIKTSLTLGLSATISDLDEWEASAYDELLEWIADLTQARLDKSLNILNK